MSFQSLGIEADAMVSNSMLGRLLSRITLMILPPDLEMPIWFGPLRGKKWIIGSFLHRCWLGVYEYRKQRLFARSIRPGQVIYDVGANVGYYSLLASSLIGDTGLVVAFEPLPRNVDFLKRHIAINHISNLMIINAAVADRSGRIRFSPGAHHAMGRVQADGSMEFEAVSLDDCIHRLALPSAHIIKMDIEGGEFIALLGARTLLKEFHPTIFLATHGPRVHHDCCQLLSAIGYKLKAIDGRPIAQSRELVASFLPQA